MYRKDRVNVIMPVYNEQKTLREIVGRVLAQKLVDQLIIVDDFSGDKSWQMIRELAKGSSRISAFRNERNMGKGYSVRKGIDRVKSGIIIIQDADLEYFPEDYLKLVRALGDDNFVLGTRVRGDRKRKGYVLSRFANATFSSLFDVLYNQGITDINTCYKVFKKEMLRGIKLTNNGFLLDPEIVVKLVKKGYKIREVDIRYKGRSYKEGKRINAKDAVDQGLYILTSRFRGDGN